MHNLSATLWFQDLDDDFDEVEDIQENTESELIENPLQHGWSKKEILLLLKYFDPSHDYWDDYAESIGSYIHAAIR